MRSGVCLTGEFCHKGGGGSATKAGGSASKAGVCLKSEFGHTGGRSVSRRASRAQNRNNATDAGWLSTIDAAGAAAKMLAMSA